MIIVHVVRMFLLSFFCALNVRATKTNDPDKTSHSRRVQRKMARIRGEFLLEVGLQVLYLACRFIVV